MNAPRTSLGSIPGLRGEKSEADHLKRGTATYDQSEGAVDAKILLKWVIEKLYVMFLKILNSFGIGSRRAAMNIRVP